MKHATAEKEYPHSCFGQVALLITISLISPDKRKSHAEFNFIVLCHGI